MELNQFLFPAPSPSYTSSGFIGDLIYIPKYSRNAQGDIIQFERPEPKDKETDFKASFLKESGQMQSAEKHKSNTELLNNQTTPLAAQAIHNAHKRANDDKDPAERAKQGAQSNKLAEKEEKTKTQIRISAEMKKSEVISTKNGVIPCLYMPYLGGSSKLMIYFHGNAEDIGLAMELLSFIKDMMKVHVLAMEYPGYGVYEGEPDAGQIGLDAQNVYDFLTIVQGLREDQIILFGRSIGSGPASIVASERMPCALLLMSPFMSIRDIIREQAGNLLQYIVNDRFRNIDVMHKVKCPAFFVHGQRDGLISFQHSQALQAKCVGPSSIILPRAMDHNEFDFIDDLVQPFYNFLEQLSITLDPDENDPFDGQFKFPEKLYIPPVDQLEKERKQQTQMTMWSWVLTKFVVESR